MRTEHAIRLPEQWITAQSFEQTLCRTAASSFFPSTGVTFRIPQSCKVMVEAAVRLLSLANQLVAEGVPVTLVFEGQQNEAMNYLHRANFFSVLSEHVHIDPARPDPTLAKRYQGQSKNLIEFTSIGTAYDEELIQSLPRRLANALKDALAARPDAEPLSGAAYTIFAELISNVYEHSQTALDGFAALQVYSQGNRVQVVVSDSGIGLLETFKPKLPIPELRDLPDAELIRLLLQGKLNWSAKKGDGLKGCAQNSLKYQGSVGIRLANCSVHLRPSPGGYEQTETYQQGLVSMKGTHICFSFPLDNAL
jgi:hypothetical protein